MPGYLLTSTQHHAPSIAKKAKTSVSAGYGRKRHQTSSRDIHPTSRAQCEDRARALTLCSTPMHQRHEISCGAPRGGQSLQQDQIRPSAVESQSNKPPMPSPVTRVCRSSGQPSTIFRTTEFWLLEPQELLLNVPPLRLHPSEHE